MEQPSSALSEKRKQERIEIKRSVQVLVADKILQGHLVDLSTIGVGLLINEAVDSGVELSVKFTLPDQDGIAELLLDGRVAHCTPSGHLYTIGIEFTVLSPHQKTVISAFTESKQPLA
ncbi:PilZ domain-containing protein [Thiomicrorhabdus sp. zzn3]|uniref:PilZ domain-containing protein n=1 Tax=Thiomicrorhabdus sp. zzn3 TaxID=3039775 RepID=UPI002436E19B|nr:PilZ domain-containing protein [Thiomicrorhabdus sp. zzn3]MDG6779132.1 PilZ domain-containing protein [Thiomicrorhabdus sp. zzn3]